MNVGVGFRPLGGLGDGCACDGGNGISVLEHKKPLTGAYREMLQNEGPVSIR